MNFVITCLHNRRVTSVFAVGVMRSSFFGATGSWQGASLPRGRAHSRGLPLPSVRARKKEGRETCEGKEAGTDRRRERKDVKKEGRVERGELFRGVLRLQSPSTEKKVTFALKEWAALPILF